MSDIDWRARAERAEARVDSIRDWYAQRFAALRKWVDQEVGPLSIEVRHRYYAIVANGSPSPHESADWSDTLHARTLRAERAERERDKARAEAERLERSLKDALAVAIGRASPETMTAAIVQARAGALREAAVCLREHAEAMAPGDRRAGVHMAVGMILARADEIERGDR